MNLVADHSESNMVFIHSALDDAGLSMAAFRLFCHLSRRAGKAGVYPAAESMAKTCRMNQDTVWRSLAELEDRGMLVRTSRPGRSTEVTLEPPSRWRNPGGGGKEGVPPEFRHGVAEKEGYQVAEKRGYEGYPFKEIQEGDPPKAAALVVEEFPGFEKTANVPRQIKIPAKRVSDGCFEALCIIQGSTLSNLTKSERGRLNAALAEIRAACPGLTPAEIRRRADAYRAAMPGATLTASALAAHWSRLVDSSPPDAAKKSGGAARHFQADTVPAAPDAWQDAFEAIYDIQPRGEWHQQQVHARDAVVAYLTSTSSAA